MSAQVVFVRVHEPDQVREIIAEAQKIMEDYEGPEWNYKSVFSKACDLLAARLPLQPAPPALSLPLDLTHIRQAG